MLKSERVLISESIEATPINHASYARARISMHVAASTDVARTIVATKLWQCEKRPRAGVSTTLMQSLPWLDNKNLILG